jgi:HSP20 family molecular chaperone IbpA
MVVMEMPGVNREAVGVALENNVLRVEGESNSLTMKG